MRTLTAAAIGLAAVPLVPLLLDAILVAPSSIFIDHRTRSAQVFLVNPGTSPEEVSLELKYGYPDSDSLGGVYVKLIDDPDSSAPNAAAWLRAFPRRTIVQPGERQVVRLLAQPPLELADGEYWARLIVTSHEIHPQAVANDSGVHAGVSVILRTILPVIYRKGTPQTGVTMTEMTPTISGDSAVVWVGLRREGNAAFVGTVNVEVKDPSGHVVGTESTPMGVYYAVRRRLVVALSGPAARGPYLVKVRVSTQGREDLQSRDILPAAPVTDSAVVRVP